MADLFDNETYLIRRQILKLFGAGFHIYDAEGMLLFYSHQKAFRLREDIRLYTGAEMEKEVLTISAREVVDFSAAYDVTDATTGERVGGLKRRGFKSMLRDEWVLTDASEAEIGVVREESPALAIIRRFIEILALFLPQSYHVEMDGRPVASYKQNFNPFVMKITADFTSDTERRLDRRLGLAMGVLLAAIEGRHG